MDYLFLLSRVIFGGYFLLNGINHLRKLDGLAGYAQSKGVPSPKVAVAVSGLLIILGGVGIILGIFVNLSVILILLFLIPVTFTMHRFWKETDPMAKSNEYITFMKNIALAGASLAYIFISDWPLSL